MLKPEDAASFVSETRWATLFQAAASSVVLWDHATTFDQEIEFIWLRKWTFTTLLYVLARYVGDAAFIHTTISVWASGRFLDKMCPSVLQVMPWLNQIALLAANGLVIKRVVCMYSGDKRVLGALAFGLVVFTLYSATVIIMMSKIQSLVGRIQSRSLYEVCYILPTETVPSWSWTFAVVMFVFDALVLGLSVLQGIWFAIENRHIHRDGRKVGILQHLWRTRRTLASVLLRDSILFPFIRMVMAMVIILAWTAELPPGSAQGIMMAAAASVPTLGCKLLLNLRSAYYKPFHEEYLQSELQNGSFIVPNWSLAPAGHE